MKYEDYKAGDLEYAIELLLAERNELKKQIKDAQDLAVTFGNIDGGHHKDWVIDQVVRILAGDGYDALVAKCCDGEDGPNTYDWKIGIAP